MPPRSLYPLHFQTIPKNMFTCLPKNLLKMVLLQTGHGDGSISQMSDCQRRHFPNFKILQSESQWTLAHAVVIEYDQVITCYPFNGVIIEKSDF